METKRTRLYYLDLLRIFAIFSVIIIHVSSQSLYYTSPVKSSTWLGLSLWDSVVRWSVPVFVMISGVLFLNPNRPFDFHKLMHKNVLHLVEVTAIWHLIYASYTFIFENRSGSNFIYLLVKGYNHLWFMHMIIGLYLIVPFLRKITESKVLTKYLLLLAWIAAIVIPTGLGIYHAVAEYHTFPTPIVTLMEAIRIFVKDSYFQFPMGFLIYFVGGYWISTLNFSKRGRFTIYILGLIALGSTVVGTYLFSMRFNTRDTPLFSYFYLNTFLIAIAIFVLFKQLTPTFKLDEKPEIANMILKLSKLTFGIYLVHFIVVRVLSVFVHAYDWISNTFILVPVLTIIVFILSGLITWILTKIPWVKDHLI